MIKLLVGLGNPGLQYKRTRHNAGFLFLEMLHDSLYASPWQINKQFKAEIAEAFVQGEKVLLVKPQTFMNLSGDAVAAVMNFYRLKSQQMLVVHDEIDLAPGVVKFKKDGGHAGHNGLRDIIAKIGTADFYRLRLGVGRPQVGSVADYVLSAYSSDEEVQREQCFQRLNGKITDVLDGNLALAL